MNEDDLEGNMNLIIPSSEGAKKKQTEQFQLMQLCELSYKSTIASFKQIITTGQKFEHNALC